MHPETTSVVPHLRCTPQTPSCPRATHPHGAPSAPTVPIRGRRGRPAERGAVGHRHPRGEDRAGVVAGGPPASTCQSRQRTGGGTRCGRCGRGWTRTGWCSCGAVCRPRWARSCGGRSKAACEPSPRRRRDGGGRGRRGRPRRRGGGAVAGATAGRCAGVIVECALSGGARPGDGGRPLGLGVGARGRGGPDRSARRHRSARRSRRERWRRPRREPRRATADALPRARWRQRPDLKDAATGATFPAGTSATATLVPMRRGAGRGCARDEGSTRGPRHAVAPVRDPCAGLRPASSAPAGSRQTLLDEAGGIHVSAETARRLACDAATAARHRRRDPRRRPPDADHLAGPAPGAERPRPPVPVSGMPERPGRYSPYRALGSRRGDGARQLGPPGPATAKIS